MRATPAKFVTYPLCPVAPGTIAALALAALSLGLAGCTTNIASMTPAAATASLAPATPPVKAAVTSEPLRIALLLPQGGFNETAALSRAMKQAAEMALFDANNPATQLIVKDDKGTPEGAQGAAEEAVKEGAEIILGPMFAKSVTAAAPAARTAGIPMIAFSNDRQVAGQGVYLLSYLPEPEVHRIVAFAASQGRKRFAALIPDDAYGHAVEHAFREAVSRSHGAIAGIAFYPPNANGMIEPSRRIAAAMKQAESAGAPVDALFVPAGPEALPHLAPLIAYSGIDTKKVKLLGTGAWDYPSIGSDELFVGGWYPAPDPRGWREFQARFMKTFGTQPPRMASLAYDAVATAVGLSTAPRGLRFSQAALIKPSGFQGIDGPLRFDVSGLSERALAVLEVQKFGTSIVDSVPGGPAAATRVSDASAGN